MRTTVDIPDPLYRELKSRAARKGTTVKSEILESVSSHLRSQTPLPVARRLKLPIVNSGKPGSLDLDNEKIYDIIGFP